MKAQKKSGPALKSVDPSDTKNHKIYSYGTSTAPAGYGRKKIVTVRGLPGSAFTILAQNENDEIYSFKEGGFEGTPGALSGIIPKSGVFKTVVDTQRSKNVDVRLLSTSPETDTRVITAESVAEVQSTFTVDYTGLDDIAFVDNIFTSSRVNSGGATSIRFLATVNAARTHVVNLVRQPRFMFDYTSADSDYGFVAYDGEEFKESDGTLVNALAHEANLNGQEILNDVKYSPILDDSLLEFNVEFDEVRITGQERIAENSVGHSIGFGEGVVISGTVNITKAGTKNNNIKLMVVNFLEVLDR